VVGGAVIAWPYLSACNQGSDDDPSSSSTGALLRSTAKLPESFGVPLPIPAVLQPAHSDATDHYEITQRSATAEIPPGYTTEIWNSHCLAPIC
jgi:spore coat protein A